MYNNVGKKIKGIAKFLLWFGIVAAIIVFIVYALFSRVGVVTGLLVAGLIVLSSWLANIMTYGFGELIDKTSSIEAILSDMNKDNIAKDETTPIEK